MARLPVVAACLAGLLVGFLGGRLSKEQQADGQTLGFTASTDANQRYSLGGADVFTASEDGSRLYIWTFHPDATARDLRSVPRCLGFVDAQQRNP